MTAGVVGAIDRRLTRMVSNKWLELRKSSDRCHSQRYGEPSGWFQRTGCNALELRGLD